MWYCHWVYVNWVTGSTDLGPKRGGVFSLHQGRPDGSGTTPEPPKRLLNWYQGKAVGVPKVKKEEL